MSLFCGAFLGKPKAFPKPGRDSWKRAFCPNAEPNRRVFNDSVRSCSLSPPLSLICMSLFEFEVPELSNACKSLIVLLRQFSFTFPDLLRTTLFWFSIVAADRRLGGQSCAIITMASFATWSRSQPCHTIHFGTTLHKHIPIHSSSHFSWGRTISSCCLTATRLMDHTTQSPLSESSSGILDGGCSICVDSPGEPLSAISSRDPICLQPNMVALCCFSMLFSQQWRQDAVHETSGVQLFRESWMRPRGLDWSLLLRPWA